MNERIKQLALEAFQPINDMASEGIADRHTFNMHWFQLYNQKFAELIVKECAGVGSNIVLTETEDNDMGVFLGIKQHFGVEE
jgi:hypothetical protein